MAIHSAWLAQYGQSRLDTRLATSAGLAPTGVLTSRSGIVPDGGLGLQPVSGTMQCRITPGRAFVQGLTVQGGYQIASDAPVTLTIPDGDPQYDRVDVIALQIQDQEFDTSGQTQAAIVLIEGTPSAAPVPPAVPPAAMGLFQIGVPARRSAGNGGGVSWSTAVTDLRSYTTGLGGILPAGTAAPSPPPPAPGQYADLNGQLRRWNGTAWTPVYDPIATGGNLPQVTSTTRPASPPSGKLVYETDSGAVALYNAGGWQHQAGVIGSQTLTAPASGIVFNAIPQVYRDLRLVIAAKSGGMVNPGSDPLYLRTSGDTGTNYSWNSYSATQSATSLTVANGWNVAAAQCGGIWNSYYPSAGRGVTTIDIPNYADSNNIKVWVGKSSVTDGGNAGMLQTFCGSWDNGNAITSLSLYLTLPPVVIPLLSLPPGGVIAPVGLTFLPGSTFTLYGLG